MGSRRDVSYTPMPPQTNPQLTMQAPPAQGTSSASASSRSSHRGGNQPVAGPSSSSSSSIPYSSFSAADAAAAAARARGLMPLLPLPQALRPSSPSFLFVVNALNISEEAPNGRDRWGVCCPPHLANLYEPEKPSPVFRWQDGQVTVMSDRQYTWYRPGKGNATTHNMGAIWGYDSNVPSGSVDAWQALPVFRSTSVFRGWHFRPLVALQHDAMVTDEDDLEQDTSTDAVSLFLLICLLYLLLSSVLTPLHTVYHSVSFGTRFLTLGSEYAISVAKIRRDHYPSDLYAAGKNADWVGKLVPEYYRHPHPTRYRSGGMGGDIGIILGLMGLSQAHGHAADAFIHQLWRHNYWHGRKWDFQGASIVPLLLERNLILPDLKTESNANTTHRRARAR